ncbi:nuclear pore complex subunit [Cladophialophora chaetospira]|uniref:Nuclear pore complex subunit n=1 Tax=Cladophialophora chaetospira TaxID=386627 RepID=A0AA39CFW2_9EURO|nr:nuclear pore complex subunit [Cladophialophora chaetospira]
MSLFGPPSSGPAASAAGSPFGGLNLNPTTDAFGKRKSIFEPSTSQNPSTTPSPFGGLNLNTNTTSSAAPSGSLFAPTTTAAAPFSFSTTTTTTATSGGLFSTTSTAPQQPAATTSFFGTQPTQQPATSSFFGGTTAPTTNTPAGSQPAPATAPSNRDAAYFSTLLERQKKKPKLKAESNGRHELPSLSMDLGDLARRAQEIRHRGTKQQDPLSDSRAHYLLAGSGVAPGQAYRDFQALGPDEAIPATRQPAQTFADESSSYLRDLRVKGRDAMLRESMDRVYREVDSFFEESLGIDFEEQKVRIMEHFGLVLPENGATPEAGTQQPGGFGKTTRKAKDRDVDPARSARSVFGRSAMEKSIIGTAGSGAGTTSFFKSEGALPVQAGLPRSSSQVLRELRNKEKAFISKVEELNQARLKNEEYLLLQNFAETEEQTKADSPRQLVDAYQALREIIKEGQLPLRERVFAEAYLDESGTAQETLKLKKQILDGSRSYLETTFFREIKTMVDKNPREASLGGQPTVINIVRAYIRLRAMRRDLAPDGAELQQLNGDTGDYCWVLIFYLLRCGFVTEAKDYVDSDPAFQSVERRFVSYLKAYEKDPDHRLPRKLQDMIDNEYQNRTKVGPKSQVDPYRIACYKVIGRCDLSSRNLDVIGQGVEDWLWLQFNLAREAERLEEIAGEIFGLDQICETVTEIGQKHFQKSQIEGSNGYGTFFLMQVLAGMFEHAVDYLHNFNPLSAVHFAIGLSYYGLLRVSDFSIAGNELLTFSTTQQPMINFVPLIAYHTGTFRTALPVPAVDYLSLICLNSDLEPATLGLVHTKACHECLRELCLETREFAKLLGDIRSNGSRLSGAIELRAKSIHLDSRDVFLDSITRQSAAIADQRGQVADAVLLYHLCEDYDNVVSVLNRALADAVTVDLGQAPMQLQPLKPLRSNGKSPASSTTEEGSPVSSLSLTQSTSSPFELGKNMIELYNQNAAYFNKISSSNREICGALLRLLMIREQMEANPPRYMTALEELNELGLLPLQARGSIPMIRASATAFGGLPQIVARCAGVSVVWAVRAIGGERDRISREGRWEAGFGGDANEVKDQLSSMAKDLMVFAGLVKYKLPGRVYDMLTRAGADVGGF